MNIFENIFVIKNQFFDLFYLINFLFLYFFFQMTTNHYTYVYSI